MAIITDSNINILLTDFPPGDVGFSDLPGPSSATIKLSAGVCGACQHWHQGEGVSDQLMLTKNGILGECCVDDARVTVIGVGYGSDGGAAFVTRADFGCFCHSPISKDTRTD